MREAMRRIRALGLGFALLGVSCPLDAQTKYPGVDAVFPLAVTRGQATEVEVRTNGDVQTAYAALVGSTNVRAEVVPRSEERKIPNQNAIVRIEPAADAPVGPCDLRLAARQAITTVCRIYITDFPAANESDDHGTIEKSQPIEIPSVMNGIVRANVETDWYRFEAKKGERLSFEVLGTRLHETIHKVGRFTPHFDPFLSIRDASGREIFAADDLYFADSFLSFEAPEDGVYHVVVREANYGGHPSYTYALVARRGPVAMHTFPLAARPGETATRTLVGPGIDPSSGASATVTLPAESTMGLPVLVRPVGSDGAELRELSVLASALPVVLEEEKTDEALASAQEIAMPAGVAGRLDKADDIDSFAFQAEEGRNYRFELFARRLFTPLDGVVEIAREDGRVIASGDDGRDVVRRLSRDPSLTWKAPSTGRFYVRVRDLHSRGGDGFLYHLECALAEPDFELTLDPGHAMVGPGTRTPIFVRAHRYHGFDGEVALRIEGLPAGVDAFVPPIRPGMTDACIVLSVDPAAEPAAANFTVHGEAEIASADGSARKLVRKARPLVEIYQAQRVIGDTAAIAITDKSDIGVESDVREVVLAPGEVKVIPVKLVRGERYRSGSVSLWGDWRFGNDVFGSSLPPGVTVDEAVSRLGIIGEETEGALALRAAPDAKPIDRVPTVVIGLIPIEFSVFVPFSTEPIFVTVGEKPKGEVAQASTAKE